MIVLSRKMADNLEEFDTGSEATHLADNLGHFDTGSLLITESDAPGSLPETRRALAEMVHDLPEADNSGVHVATEVQRIEARQCLSDEQHPDQPRPSPKSQPVPVPVSSSSSSSTGHLPNLQIPPVVDGPDDELESVGFAGPTQSATPMSWFLRRLSMNRPMMNVLKTPSFAK